MRGCCTAICGFFINLGAYPMLKFSVIIPSFNQPDFIEETLQNAISLKNIALKNNCAVEILLFDSESNSKVQQIIDRYRNQIDYVEIKKDRGQYDAINKGIERCSGDYWTWLNTDDLINTDGFEKLIRVLKSDPTIDYIYGGINYIDENGKSLKEYKSYELDFKTLYSHTPAIFQPGSFFKRSFTNKVGFLKDYRCCFDYEYVLNCFAHKANIYCCDFVVADFRYYKTSKTGSIIPVFIREQLEISEKYGRKWWHFLTWFSRLRLLKHKLIGRAV
jgi:glycosyltransferase involved in cell wall biosynthesis